ncbi:fibronectin type III domain-containing protein [Luteolibacter flavescens]|uniref:Fibronectin type III domain-containing protein n=1 Tax=Luteolibacter flavescens TaxID=1859460 RepID=A0ABT3FRX0_9BACT|nr:fibronectin type III domain-containing protein [Luteolibacter flavescens]MCW1886049.1 fibronectin type III domain-containing protein [Luteolibacter flavescens]
MKRLILALSTLAASHAATVPFESEPDLAAYTVTNLNGALTRENGIGAGNPVTGGLRYQGNSGGNDRGAVARKLVPVAQADGVWTSSILLSPREIDSSTSDKAEVRMGFAATDTTNASKPWEYFHKNNDSISLTLKAEHKPSDSKTRQIECEITNRVTSEANSMKLAVNNSAHFDDWLRLTLKMVRSGGNDFSVSYTLESLGADGTAAPVAILSSTPVTLANAPLATAASVYEGFAVKTEKSKTTSVFFDDHETVFSAVAPQSPVAAAATAVAAQGFTAGWQAPAAGVYPASYVLEVTTAANNFAPGSFLAADGTPGQAAGIPVSGLSQAITGLSPQTAYVYRVRSVNVVGQSDPSAVTNVQTLSLTQNSPPTLDAIGNVGPFSLSQSTVVIPLTGISAGGETDQTVTVSATSSNPAIATASVSHTSPADTGSLTLTMGDTEGTATITVTANDGQAADHTTTRTFTVTLRNPPAVLGFESAADLDDLAVTTNANLVHTWQAGAGAGDPASGGIVVSSSSTSGDHGFVGWRKQGHPLAGSSLLRTSILFNPSQVDDATSDEAKLELRVGFIPTLTLNASKPHEFLHKSNQAISVVIKAEHKPSDASKSRKIEAEIGNADGSGDETKAGKLTLLNSASMNNWLRVSLTLVPAGGSTFLASYQLEDLGEHGTSTPVVIMESGPFSFTNAAMGSAADLYAAYAGKLDKQLTYLRLDDHRSVAQTDPPSAPQAAAATQVTASSFQANWQPAGEVYPAGWIVEVVPDGASFTAGNFISATGSTGQAAGIILTESTARTLRISGLAAGTGYRYRVIGTNPNGSSDASGEIAVTTLAAGMNARPTLAAIANPAPIAINGAQQTVALSGITSGGEEGQTLSVTATSSNPGLIPNPVASYTSPATTGSLAFTPVPGVVGNAVITVTVSDGASNNATYQRTFTVIVVDPDPVIDFDDPADLNAIAITTSNATLTHAPAGGTSSSGGLAFVGSTSNDRVAFAVRPTAFDAASASYLMTSIDFNAAEVLNVTSGKDKGEIRLGFLGNATPNANNPKDTMNKTHPSLGVKFSIEEDTTSSDKRRKVEAEVFSWNGSTENKGEKLSLNNVAQAGNWFRITLLAVRSGASQFAVSYTVDDMGVDGAGFVSRLIESTPMTIAAASLAADSSVFSAFTVMDEKGSTSTIKLDRFASVVSTTAPEAPATLTATDITEEGFTVNWSAPLTGAFAEGYIVEIVDANAAFLPGNFYGEDGKNDHDEGILVTNPFAEDLPVYVLDNMTSYRVRVRSYGEAPAYEESMALNSTRVTTTFGPGLEYAAWREQAFGANASDPLIAGPDADPDHDGMSNLLEYALGFDPNASDAHLMPKANINGPYLSITYKRRHNVTGVIYQAAATGDLADWHPEQTVEKSVSAPDADGMETVVVEDLYPKGNFPKRFLRVSVNLAD